MRVGGQQQYAGQKSFCSLATFLRNHRGNMQSHLEFSNGRTKEPQMEEREREKKIFVHVVTKENQGIKYMHTLVHILKIHIVKPL